MEHLISEAVRVAVRVGSEGIRSRRDGYCPRDGDVFPVVIVGETRTQWLAAHRGESTASIRFRKSDLRETPREFCGHYFNPKSQTP